MWNQAMIELGALLCRSDPSCHRCPIRSSCDWFVGGCVEPDPAHRSASVSRRQSRFAGSDRQGRGRLLAGLRAGPVSASSIPGVMGWPDDPARSIRVADSLVADGLARRVEDRFELP
jgi:A/G-specific adenine glycosylase